MAKKKKAKETDTGTLGRLSKVGEDAFTRLVDELAKNERVTDALSKALSAKGKVDEGAKRALGQVGVAAADELKDLRHPHRAAREASGQARGETQAGAEAKTDGQAQDVDDRAGQGSGGAEAVDCRRRPGPPRLRLTSGTRRRSACGTTSKVAGVVPGCSPSSAIGSGTAVRTSTRAPRTTSARGCGRYVPR